ncbi:MAG: hypothetical protein V1847_01165 [Candidatus Diapherotrites archaeon]
MFENWFKAFYNPEVELEKEKKKADLWKGVLNYCLIPTIAAFAVGIIVSVVSVLFGSLLSGVEGGDVLQSIGMGAFILLPVLAFVGVAILSLLCMGFTFLGAKLMKSKGNFTTLYYLSSVFLPALYLIVIGLFVIYIIGLALASVYIGILISLVAMAFIYVVFFYYLYLYWLVLKTALNLPNQKLIIAEAIGFILLFIVAAIIVFAIAAAVYSAMGIDASTLIA